MLSPSLVASALIACGSSPRDSSAPVAPPSEAPVVVADTGFAVDTGLADGPRDETPEHTLTLLHEGVWDMTPLGGPYSAMTGALTALEILDDDALKPACELTYGLTGVSVDDGCDGCDFTFEVSFYLIEGDPSMCSDPEIPADGDRWVLGFAPTGDGAGVLSRDYAGVGVWIPWYEAALKGDALTFQWTATVGIERADEED